MSLTERCPSSGAQPFLELWPSGIVTSDGGDSCTTVPIAANDANLTVFAGAYLP
jgi:hypothetical protein